MSKGKVDIALIGAMKSASTTVTDYLRQHPDVFVPERKLLNYFSYGMANAQLNESDGVEATASEQAIRNERDYLAQFDGADPGQLWADCSDSYYFFPGTAERLYAHNPNMKIVVVMRDPVSRAYSSFNHARSHLLETVDDFMTAFNRPEGEEAEVLPIRRYKLLGRYADLLQPYVDTFGVENIHLIGFEELLQDHQQTLTNLTTFLGLAPFKGEQIWSNPTFVPPSGLAGRAVKALKGPARGLLRFASRSKARRQMLEAVMRKVFKRPDALSADQKNRLKPVFQADIQRLEKMFGPGFYSHWV